MTWLFFKMILSATYERERESERANNNSHDHDHGDDNIIINQKNIDH